jgi:hypothetical protein
VTTTAAVAIRAARRRSHIVAGASMSPESRSPARFVLPAARYTWIRRPRGAGRKPRRRRSGACGFAHPEREEAYSGTDIPILSRQLSADYLRRRCVSLISSNGSCPYGWRTSGGPRLHPFRADRPIETAQEDLRSFDARGIG